MESLLSLSFDYLSSFDGIKIKKGLRQLEGLLAQICLSSSKSTPDPTSSSTSSTSTAAAERRRSVLGAGPSLHGCTDDAAPQPKELASLTDDPAFREFFKLQEGFEWNDGQNDLLVVSTLDLLQGILLIHPPSRSLFSREIYMNLLLDLLDPSSCPAIQSVTLLALVTTLLEHPANTRTFESLDGLLTVTSLFKTRSTSREVKMKVVEFLYFYLMPETPIPSVCSGGSRYAGASADRLQRSPSKRLGRGSAAGGAGVNGEEGNTRTTEEKQKLLGRYLNNVEDLVEDLRESAPFGANFT
ncbi:hypothetical protein MMC07_001257 [Pseudocyphellaria aurata]|nr:hypothetical protein [Pseudocyphellaria aurata]